MRYLRQNNSSVELVKLLKKEILEHYEFDPQDNNAMLYGKCNECMHEQETKK